MSEKKETEQMGNVGLRLPSDMIAKLSGMAESQDIKLATVARHLIKRGLAALDAAPDPLFAHLQDLWFDLDADGRTRLVAIAETFQGMSATSTGRSSFTANATVVRPEGPHPTDAEIEKALADLEAKLDAEWQATSTGGKTRIPKKAHEASKRIMLDELHAEMLRQREENRERHG